MIRLTYSNRSEKLLDALAADLSAPGRDPFEPVRLVVPNRNVETWLRHGLARRLGIAANLEVEQLRRFVGGLLEEAVPGTRLIDGELLLDLVLTCLLDEERMARPGLGRLRSYVHAAGDRPEALDLRRYQLASELARLFDEYGHSRPEMLGTWPREAILAGTAQEETEAWQRRLWLEIFGRGGLAQERAREQGEQWWHLPQLLDRLGEIDLAAGVGPIRLVGISYVASAFHRIFARLARDAELDVYTLNPCMEFWEDVEAAQEVKARLSKRIRLGPARLEESIDPFGLTEGGDTPALSLWGKPGRENVRLLNELAECDFRAVFEEVTDERPSLLRQLQQDILVRHPERTQPEPSFDFAEDRSVRILACPGVRREVEAIAEAIWELVHRDASRAEGEPLRFNDIAVLIAGSEPETYFTHLAAVFEETYGIPFNRTGTSLQAESRVAEAVELLLGLPAGRGTRAEVLAFVTHPNVIAAHPDADPADWVRWCERLGIVRGLDRGDLAGSYVEEDLLSWEQGLRRMALGAFLDEDGSFAVGSDDYLPEGLPEVAYASFGASIRRLLDDLREVRSRRASTAEWARTFAGMVERYVVPRGEAEERDLDRAVRAIRGIGSSGLGGADISYTLAVELARRSLGGLGGAKGQYLAGGVVVSTLQPMRAIPFRAIFVAGLGEGRFPAAERLNHLDLRLARPRVGDVTQREGDQYMFLEAILCARENAFFSYVARDQLTGDELRPSTVLAELERMLVRGYGATGLVRKIPLRRFDEPAPFASPAALREAATVALREDLRRALPTGSIPPLDDILQGLAPGDRDGLMRHLGLDPRRGCGDGVAAPRQREKPLSLSLSQIRKFLECPAQGSAGIVLGLDEDFDEGEDSVEDEAFGLGALEKSILLKNVFLSHARGDGVPDLKVRWDEAARLERLSGRYPLGPFGDAARASNVEILQGWDARLQKILDGGPSDLQVIRFGPSPEHDDVDRVVDRLSFEVDLPGGPRTVELRGTTEPLLAGGTCILVLKPIGSGGPAVRKKVGLRAWITHLAMAASGLDPEEGIARTVHFCPNENVTLSLRAIRRDEAREHLRALLEDMLGSVHDYFLPCDLAIAGLRAEAPDWEELADGLKDPWSRCSSQYGPLRSAMDLSLPDDPEGLARRRFGLYFAAEFKPEKKGKKR